MSEEDLSDIFQPDMRIQVESLMGTVFDLDVSSLETISDVKKKIHQMEGIPTMHQNLIFRSKDLKDSYRLIDAGITDGSRLTLVPSMRGGPISTRRVSIARDNHVMFKDLKELFENTRDDGSPSKVTVIFYRQGETLNLLRLVGADEDADAPPPPPAKPKRRRRRNRFLRRCVENSETSRRLYEVRAHMARRRRAARDGQTPPPEEDVLEEGPPAPPPEPILQGVDYLGMLEELDMERIVLGVRERREEEEVEVALKDKHRSKPHTLCDSETNSLYSVTRGAHSSLKQSYTTKGGRSGRPAARSVAPKPQACTVPVPMPIGAQASPPTPRFHLRRVVLSSDSGGRPQSPAMGDGVGDLWEMPDTAPDRGASCDVGLLNRRQSVEYGTMKGACDDSYLEVCPEDVFSMPGRDYYIAQTERSPLYSRSSPRKGSQRVEEPPKAEELPPVMKKRARCNKCNRKLNVTNIHSCRCGKIFCAQHRYSEVHQCDYDYKAEGRRLLRQQNPKVTAPKIDKI